MIITWLKPGVPKRHLLLNAASLWLIAAVLLIYRGKQLLPGTEHFWPGIFLAAAAGIFMFFLVFLQLSIKLIRRIRALEILKPCVFSFFDLKGYIMMFIMIGLGIFLRRSEIISEEILAYFYFSMSIPLLLSSLRFFLAWIRYPAILEN
jgi:hypothetical protein